MMTAKAGTPDRSVIRVHVADLRQLFNTMDPSPFHDKDLDPGAEEFIVSWSRELPRKAPLSLLVHLDSPAGLPGDGSAVENAIQKFFSQKGILARMQLRELFRRGRISLVIGLTFLTAALSASNLLPHSPTGGIVEVLRTSLSIGGWVAMWRPIEVFLYEWWPIVADARLFDRLAVMPVRISVG